MADAFTAAQTGIDPTTGSYLSPSARKALFRSATVSGSVFGGGGGALVRQPKSELATAQGVQLLESNQQTLGTITEQLNSLRDQISSLTNGINAIANQIANESAVENSRLQEEQDQQRKLAEAEVRIGRENELEKKLQNALVAPVQRASQQTMGFLERIKQALFAMFGGWLTNQILDLYSASKEENKTKFEEIKNNIIKNLFYAGGAFLAINAGFNVFLGIAGRVAGLIAKLSAKILTAPFKAAGALANAAFRPNAPKPPSNTSGGGSTNVKPKGKFGFMSVVRGAITGLSGVMNFLNGENVDATLTALSFIPGKGWMFKGIRNAARAVFTLDEVAEAFGSNLTGKKKSELQEEQKRLEAEQNNKSSGSGSDETEAKVEANPASTSLKFIDQSKEDSGSSTSSTSTSSSSSSTSSTGSSSSSAGSSSNIQSSTSTSTGSNLNVSSVPSTSFNELGPESKPAPEVVLSSPPPSTPPLTPQSKPGFAADVPGISSSNENNFYSMYSKLTYNVVG